MYETTETTMGTRGTITLYIGKQRIRLYNHCDSYLSGLGVKLLEQIKACILRHGADEFVKKLTRLRVVDDSTPITLKDVTALLPYSDVGDATPLTWMNLTWKMQGNLSLMLESGYLYNSSCTDSEYDYTINFNDSWISCNDSPGYYFADIDKVLSCWSRDQTCYAAGCV